MFIQYVSYCLLAAALLLVGPLQAQVNNFQPAYYLNAQGDTIHTEISQDGDIYLSKFIKVRKDEGGNTVEMRPVEVSGFGFPEQSLHYQRISHKYETEDGEKIEVPRFARRLVAGYYDLYRLEQFAGEFVKELSDVPSHTYYLSNQEGEVFKLEQVEETVTGTRYRIIDRYKGGLKYLMQDWIPIRTLAEKARFEDLDISNIVRDYNGFRMPKKTTSEATITSSRNSYHKFRLAIPIANLGSKPSLQNGYSGGYSFHLFNPQFSNSVTIGIGLELIQTNYDKRDAQGFSEDIGGEVVTAFNLPIIADYYLSQRGLLKPKIKFLLSPSITKIDASYVSRNSIQLGGSTFVQRSIETGSSTIPVLYYGLGVGAEIADFEVNIRANRSLFFQLEGVEESLNGNINIILGVEYILGKKD